MTAGGPGVHIEIDGAPATVGQLSTVAPGGCGHFTAMQVRNRQVRGLGLHLAMPVDAALMRTVTEAYESAEWDPI